MLNMEYSIYITHHTRSPRRESRPRRQQLCSHSQQSPADTGCCRSWRHCRTRGGRCGCTAWSTRAPRGQVQWAAKHPPGLLQVGKLICMAGDKDIENITTGKWRGRAADTAARQFFLNTSHPAASSREKKLHSRYTGLLFLQGDVN